MQGPNSPAAGCAVKPADKPHRRSKLPLTIAAIERLLGAARSMPGELDGIPAGQWWPALILLMLDTGEFAPALLRLPAEAYDPAEGTLFLKRKARPLHAHAANALDVLHDANRLRLLPWPKDNGKPPFHMLYQDYRGILHRAGLPPAVKNPFGYLRSTAADVPEVLDCIDPHRPFHPVQGTRHKERSPRKPKPKADPPPETVYRIADASPRTLRRFFEETYRPLRLVLKSEKTVEKYYTTIKLFSDFTACDATLDQFTENRLDEFKVWCLGRMQAATANGYLRHLLALWRYAWKKRRLDKLPRDVEMLPEIKRIPEAWSQEEMARLLEAAGETAGEICGLPARLWWPALILVLYDTGLRIDAAVRLPSANLDLETGWLRVAGETQKQKADQVFRLHADTIETLEAMAPERRERLFNYHFKNRPNQLRPITRGYEDILERAGLPATAKDKFHKIRRTSATYLAEAIGEDEAVKHLGHSHPSVTRRYLDISKITRRMTAADVLPRPEWKPPQSA